nr:putative zinc finger, CCHC-type [Tanacetum cinerariifolium]
MDGTVHTYKARLVAKGFTQTYGVDYEETFAHVADIRAIKILVAIVAFYDYEIWQMDVKTVFLNGHLFEEVYMVQPEGFVNPKYPNRRGSIPIQDKSKLCKSQSALTPTKVQRIQRVSYASAIESIMYAVRCTLPDVAFTQNITSRFQHNLGDIKRELRVACYTDAGYMTNVDDCNYQTGYVFVLNGDNESIITKGARHYRAKVHYLREVIELGDVKTEKVHTYDNLAGPFTKALPLAKHSEHTQNI